MDIPIQFPWHRRVFSPRLSDLSMAEPFSDWPFFWPMSWSMPWMRPSIMRWFSWSDNGHSEVMRNFTMQLNYLKVLLTFSSRPILFWCVSNVWQQVWPLTCTVCLLWDFIVLFNAYFDVHTEMHIHQYWFRQLHCLFRCELKRTAMSFIWTWSTSLLTNCLSAWATSSSQSMPNTRTDRLEHLRHIYPKYICRTFLMVCLCPQDDHGFVSREFVRKYKLPAGVTSADVTSSLSIDGVLTITVPRVSLSTERSIPISCEDGTAKQKM